LNKLNATEPSNIEELNALDSHIREIAENLVGSLN
jgi:hypothetical protein